MTKVWPLLAVALGAGAAGYWIGARGPKSAATTSAASRDDVATFGAALSTAHVAVDLSALRADLKKMIHEELAAQRSGHATAGELNPTGELNPPPRPSEPPPESAHAVEASHRLIATSLSTHRWTRDQKAQLRDLLPLMTDEQREATLAELIPAINRQEIVPEQPGPPF